MVFIKKCLCKNLTVRRSSNYCSFDNLLKIEKYLLFINFYETVNVRYTTSGFYCTYDYWQNIVMKARSIFIAPKYYVMKDTLLYGELIVIVFILCDHNIVCRLRHLFVSQLLLLCFSTLFLHSQVDSFLWFSTYLPSMDSII